MTNNTSIQWSQFKRNFVGPVLTRRIRKAIGYQPNFVDIVPGSAIIEPRPVSAYMKQSIESKARWISYVVSRKQKILKATPKWVNHTIIESIYAEAQYLSRITGIPHEVDHIIPIAGKLVCGLHVESNLQILPEKINQLKTNKFIIE